MKPLTAQSSKQIVSGYLAMVRHLPQESRLDSIADLLAVTFDAEIRAPLLREFNDLSEREKANV